MLTILLRYLYRNLLGAFAMTLCASSLIMALFMLLKQVQAEVPPRYVFNMLALSLPYVLTWTIPVALITACVVTYGQMAADNELTALRAAGVHLFTVVVPALVLGVLFSIVGIYVNDDLSPFSSESRRGLIDEITQNASFARLMLEDPILEVGDRLKILAWDVRGDELRDVMIHMRDDDGRVSVIRAQSARLESTADGSELALEISDGRIVSIDPVTGRPLQTSWMRFASLNERIEVKEKDQKKKFITKHMTTRELVTHLRSGQQSEDWKLDARIAIHTRRALALSTLAFALLGVPLGMLTRTSSKFTGFALAVLVLFGLFYPLLLAGRTLSQEQMLPPWVGLWLANIVVGLLGVVFLAVILRR